ncbi:uncharacterized protein EI90DRAFT_3065405 [Cantharellus anzutake]|uniref:uncharacterized protein n=1 Tax=Cantharellus anzutake TaxID=1750568 RepID=UPI0019074132|nr:uncharacterized protein EI90DRAFT_3065405 [Cantharellus anzutake]KAF8328452.1 hypothetical protein EI90DRAFT_3065405 [Cantharellus anzutake]
MPPRRKQVPRHAHPNPQQQPQQSQQHPQAQQMQVSPPEPAVQAAIDAQFRPVNLKLGADDGKAIALCASHGREVCGDCGLDFTMLNQTSRVLQSLPSEMPVPPPPHVVHPQRSPLVQKAKEEGNQLFKRNKHEQAISKYGFAANLAASRFPWETSNLTREELSIVVCNRSAAYLAAGDPVGALIDADVVVQLKRPWSKGHFRKAKALLALGKLEDARESAFLGLQFEPDSSELSSFVEEIDALIEKNKSAG